MIGCLGVDYALEYGGRSAAVVIACDAIGRAAGVIGEAVPCVCE